MQIFVTHTNPERAVQCSEDDDTPLCDQWVVKMQTEACQLLISVCHARAAAGQPGYEWLQKPVPGPGGEQFEVWKPLSKGHLKHECYLWVLADKHHFDWTLRHGLALCEAYTHRFGKTHKAEWHLKNIQSMLPDSDRADSANSTSTLTVDGFLDFLSKFDPELRASKFQTREKFCETNPPEGCLFGILAGPTRVSDDITACYRNYCREKRNTFKTPMRFTESYAEKTNKLAGKRRRESHDSVEGL